MKTYYLSCKKHTNNAGSKKVTIANTVITQTSRSIHCNICHCFFNNHWH